MTQQTNVRPIAQYAHAPILVLVASFLMLQPLSTDLYLASLPSLGAVFNAPSSTVQLTLSMFVIAFGGAQLIMGPLSDRFGRRPVVIGGLALYVLASLLCALAPTIELLIAARFVQALGCCSAIVIARAIVRDAYAPADSVRVVARASTWLSLAPLLGPILGSYLQVTFGWRAAFVALSLLSAMVLTLVLLRLPETNEHKNPHATDLSGLAANWRIVLGSREFWAYALPGALSYGSIFAFISGVSPVLIKILHVPVEWFGYCFAAGVSGYMSGTILCRRLLPAFGQVATLRIGTTMSLAAGALFLTAVGFGLAHWALVTLATFLTMLAHGVNFPVSQSGSVTPFPKQAGTAAGLMGALYMLVAFGVGTAVGGTFNGTLYPLALIACTMTASAFLAVRVIGLPVPKAAT